MNFLIQGTTERRGGYINNIKSVLYIYYVFHIYQILGRCTLLVKCLSESRDMSLLHLVVNDNTFRFVAFILSTAKFNW